MNLLRNNQGQGLTEYIILLMLVAIVSIGAVQTVGSRVKQKLQVAANHINKDVVIDRD